MSTLQNSNLIAAAVGATIGVISVATVFIYNKVMERQQQAAMKTNIDRVNRKVVELQTELEELRYVWKLYAENLLYNLETDDIYKKKS